MTSLYLPAPKRNVAPSSVRNTVTNGTTTTTELATISSQTKSQPQLKIQQPIKVPSYEHRCKAASDFARLTPSQRKTNSKKLFVPRSTADFDDGGSFPEIHVAQYPKNMGNPHLNKRKGGGGKTGGGKNDKKNTSLTLGASTSTTQAIVNVEIDASGNKDYTSLIKGGTNSSKKVFATHADLKGYTPTSTELALPTQTEEQSTASKTQAAIDALLASKVALSKPSGSALEAAATSRNPESKTQFISYTPNPNAPGYNAKAAPKRIIQMVPAQLDPMMPPKHKHEKAPPGPGEDFTPVLHAPNEKLTKEERESWNVPACISNWKNSRGYTIPLDKRLAADGRGLRDDTTINSNFATLSESLYLAERNAREEVRMRALVKKRQVETEKERREVELRELAMRAREERSGGGVGGGANYGNGGANAVAGRVDDRVQPAADASDADYDDSDADVDADNNDNDSISGDGPSAKASASSTANIIPEDSSTVDDGVKQRERIRQERKRERERELRMERQAPNKRNGSDDDNSDDEDVNIKKARLGDRDISEKIALGVHTGSGGGTAGVDNRLYNQSAGMDSGFGADDEYNTYSKPMFDRQGVTSSSIYRPTRGEGAMDADEQYSQLKGGATARFQPDVGFKGADGGTTGGTGGGNARNAPVQFEKS